MSFKQKTRRFCILFIFFLYSLQAEAYQTALPITHQNVPEFAKLAGTHLVSVISKQNFSQLDDHYFYLRENDNTTIGKKLGLCSIENKIELAPLIDCSAVLIDEQTLLVPQQCIPNYEICRSKYFVTQANNLDFKDSFISSENMYQCENLNSDNEYYSLVKLDRPVKDLKPTKLRSIETCGETKTWLIGSYLGATQHYFQPTSIYKNLPPAAIFSGRYQNLGIKAGSLAFHSGDKLPFLMVTKDCQPQLVSNGICNMIENFKCEFMRFDYINQLLNFSQKHFRLNLNKINSVSGSKGDYIIDLDAVVRYQNVDNVKIDKIKVSTLIKDQENNLPQTFNQIITNQNVLKLNDIKVPIPQNISCYEPIELSFQISFKESQTGCAEGSDQEESYHFTLMPIQYMDIECNTTTFSNLTDAVKRKNQVKRLEISAPDVNANIALLSNLEELKITSGVLEEFPSELSQNQKLHTLDISNLGIFKIPGQISSLKNLKTLLASNNQIKIIPEEIALLPLITLDLNSNQISDLPGSLPLMKVLQQLILSNNNISVLPSRIGQLESLQFLLLSQNPVSQVPEAIGQLKKLKFLDLKGNKLSWLQKNQIKRWITPAAQILF